MHICLISSSMMDRDITMASSSSTENNNINNNEGSSKPSESVQITGLELLTGQEPATTATTTAAAPAVKSNPNTRPTNTCTTTARPMLSPKKAPAFIRGGKKKIVRTKSMPTTTSNKRGTSSSPKPTTSNTRRLQAPPPLLQQQHHQQQSPKAASSGARRRNMNRSGGLSPQRPSTSSQQRQQSPQQKQPLARASSARMVGQRRASMGASLNISGHAALPRISRRVSIGNEQVGVTQTTWGLKPMRRSSLTHANKTGGGNYQYAANSQLHAPPISTNATAAQQQQQQQQQQQRKNHQNQNQNNNAHQMQTQTQNQNYMMVETAQDSFSRRSSLSSHGSDFSELGDSGSTAASGTGIAYLTNVASLGYNTPHAAAPHLSLLHHQQQQEQQQRRRLSNDSGFTDYSYANDSLDLRKKNPKKNSATRNNRMSVDKNDEQDFDDDSFGDDDDTYAADSLDLRQYRKKKQGSTPPPQAQTQQSSSQRMAVDRDDYDNDSYYDDDDDSIGDDDTYAADSLDLRRKSSSVRHVVERQSSLNLDDSASSSAYSCAADSLDMRKLGDKMHAKHVIPSREELGYGEDNNDDTINDNDDNQHHNKTTHMSNTTTKNENTAVVDLGYGDTGPSRRISAEDLGYGDVAPERKTGGGAWQDDEDSFGTYSYAADSLDLRLKQRKTGATARTASTAAEDDDDYYDDDDDDEDYEDDEDCEVETDSNKTPVDYMTRIVMGYSKKNKESEPAQASTDENEDGSNDEDDDDSRVHNDDDDDAEEDDEDSNKTPVDYMTQIVMGYANSNKNETSDGAGMMGRRTSEGSTASSIYSYACDSVVMKPTLSKNANKTIDIKSSGPPTSLAKASPYANREGYDDDDDDEDDEEYSDYTDDEEDVDYRRRGGGGGGGGGRNSAYLSGVLGYGHQNKPKLVASTSFDAGMERRFSCDSYANDSVNMRKAGGEKKKKKSFGEARRESMDSLTSGISTNDLDPSYLNNVLGYAMDASANSANNTNDPRELLINAPYAASSMMDSMTSMGSESEGEWALSPTIPQQRKPKVPMSTSKAMQTSATSLGAFSTDTSASEGLGYEDMGMS